MPLLLRGVNTMKSYSKNEDTLGKYYNNNSFLSSDLVVNNHINTILNKLDNLTRNDNYNNLNYEVNFINELIQMPISVFNKAYVSMLLMMDLSFGEQELLLKQIDLHLNTCIFADERAYKSVSGQKEKTMYLVPHKYEPSDIVRFFKMLQIKTNRFIDSLIVDYLRVNNIDDNLTIDSQKEEILKCISSIDSNKSPIANYIFERYNKWVYDMPNLVKIYLLNSENDILLQIKEILKYQLIELSNRKDINIGKYQKHLSVRINNYRLTKRSSYD